MSTLFGKVLPLVALHHMQTEPYALSALCGRGVRNQGGKFLSVSLSLLCVSSFCLSSPCLSSLHVSLSVSLSLSLSPFLPCLSFFLRLSTRPLFLSLHPLSFSLTPLVSLYLCLCLSLPLSLSLSLSIFLLSFFLVPHLPFLSFSLFIPVSLTRCQDDR